MMWRTGRRGKRRRAKMTGRRARTMGRRVTMTGRIATTGSREDAAGAPGRCNWVGRGCAQRGSGGRDWGGG